MKKILNKHKSWKAIAIGDEPRENIKIEHVNFIFTGWIQHEKVLKIYPIASALIEYF